MPAQSVAARVLQHSRNGRRTYLRARRSSAARLPPALAFGPVEPLLSAGGGGILPPAFPGAQHQPGSPLAQQPASGTAGSWHVHDEGAQPQDAVQQQQQHGGDGSTWVAPQVQFTLGWHDPSDVRNKRGRRRRIFRA